MANIDFCYATMGAGKTIEACKVAFNYEENGLSPLCLMPEVDNRAGEFEAKGNVLVGKWKSRMPGVEREAYVIPKGAEIERFIRDLVILYNVGVDAILIDEVQFLSVEQVEELFKIALFKNIPIKVFGLLTNFQTEMFDGSRRLIELGANLDTMMGISRDGEVTVINARFNADGSLATRGQEVMVGGDEKYKAISLREYWKLLNNNYL